MSCGGGERSDDDDDDDDDDGGGYNGGGGGRDDGAAAEELDSTDLPITPATTRIMSALPLTHARCNGVCMIALGTRRPCDDAAAAAAAADDDKASFKSSALPNHAA